MRKRILRLFLTLFILISFPAFASGERDSLSHSDRQVLNQVADSIARSHNWKTLLKERKLDPKDTTVVYPKFLGFCVKVYNWADRVFNSYDTTYVVGTGKKWKARILSDNWVDSYYLNPGRKMPMRMMSDVYSNLGAYIQFMAVSLGYSFDLGRFFGQTPSTHNKLEFNFNCARFNVEGHFWESYGGTYIRTFGGYNNGHLIKEFFPGARQRTLAAKAYYFFNNRKFAMGAAYNFSKIQKKSAGSAIIGLNFSHVNIMMDMFQLPENPKDHLTIDPMKYVFHYNSWSVISGYSYNLVCNPHLLLNFTLFPGLGYSRAFGDSVEADAHLLAMNISAQSSLTYNLKNFFICAIAKMEGNWYNSNQFSFFSSVENLQLSIGLRF